MSLKICTNPDPWDSILRMPFGYLDVFLWYWFIYGWFRFKWELIYARQCAASLAILVFINVLITVSGYAVEYLSHIEKCNVVGSLTHGTLWTYSCQWCIVLKYVLCSIALVETPSWSQVLFFHHHYHASFFKLYSVLQYKFKIVVRIS